MLLNRNPSETRRLAQWMRSAFHLVMLLAAILISACTHSSEEQDTWTVKSGDSLPQFKLSSTDGKAFSNADLAGKVSVIAIWATWCPPCRMELPELDSKIYQPLKAKGVQVLGVNAGEETQAVTQFAKQSGLTFPLLTDPEHTFSTAVGGDFLPRSLVVDKKGKVRSLHVGFEPAAVQELTKEVEKLAAEK